MSKLVDLISKLCQNCLIKSSFYWSLFFGRHVICVVIFQVLKHFISNNHHVVLTMSPDEKFVAERESILTDLESKLVRNLTDSDREKISEIEKRLLEEQSTKENDESIACLPTLQMADIPQEKPIYKVKQKHNFSSQSFVIKKCNNSIFFTFLNLF